MKFLATIHLLIDTSSQAEACDAVSGLLTEGGLYEEGSCLIDWAYIKQGQRYIGPREVDVPADYDRDEDDLNDLAGDEEAYIGRRKGAVFTREMKILCPYCNDEREAFKDLQ